jgi:hypothetical protein
MFFLIHYVRPPLELFQRAVHVECKGSEKYWNLIDTRLEFIRTRAGSDTSKTLKYVTTPDFIYDILILIIYCRAFNGILKADRLKFGTGEEYVIGDTVVDEWQQHVDNVVLGTSVAA